MTIINNIEIDNITYNENCTKKAVINNEPIEDKLHIIIVLSNPCNTAIRYILAREFIRRMKDEKDIVLYIVELAYGSQDFHITDSRDKKHLQLRSHDTPIWNKENLINIGVKRLLPSNWKSMAWIDSDIEFESTTWASDTLKILNGHKDVVQLFSHVDFMDANGDTEHIFVGFGFQYLKKMKRSTGMKKILSYWHPGFAWACTKKFYDKMGGLYEYAITGDGDMLMASCFISNYMSALPRDVSTDYRNSLKKVEERIVGCRLGYVPGIIRHHYHGSIKSRNYDSREQILTKNNYSPTIHLCYDKNGLLIPSDKFPKSLMDDIMSHFQSKDEDSSLKRGVMTISKDPPFAISLPKLLKCHFKKKGVLSNCFLINLKKDTERLKSSQNELKKLEIDYTCLDATYWKNESQFTVEFYIVLEFLSGFNKAIDLDKTKFNDFSEPQDHNIKIQDAPLACFCSHVSAMIHGYQSNKDYTIICEDDISVEGLDLIQNCIPMIPNDWDIICLNSLPIDGINKCKSHFYKFTDTFYHLHFYIVRDRCFETIFENLYPITDQIDILIGNLHDKLNIYNIPNTVFQRGFITNVQNNLHLVYNTPVYKKVVKEFEELGNIVLNLVNTCLLQNEENNLNITSKILQDVVYNNIFNDLKCVETITTSSRKEEKYPCDEVYNQLNKIVGYLTRNGQNFHNFIQHMINEIDFILSSFTMHNKYSDRFEYIFKAYNFGSSASVYKCDREIFKVYNERLRWKNEGHDNIREIFHKELELLKKIDPDIEVDEESLTLKIMFVISIIIYPCRSY